MVGMSRRPGLAVIGASLGLLAPLALGGCGQELHAAPGVLTTTTTTTTIPPVTAPPTTVDPITTVHDRACVRTATDGDTLEKLAASLGKDVTLRSLWYENGFIDTLTPGQLVDICPDNGINDLDGTAQLRAAHPDAKAALQAVIKQQQAKVNELFKPYGTRPLTVDGVPGPSTGQRLCAARLLLGLKVSVDDMEPASSEMAALMAATEVKAPKSDVRGATRWALIDKTCQMMFIGAGKDLTFIFPTSTGGPDTETRLTKGSPVFRYNPAVENGGWHNSSQYPVGVDNPLNGNLYKPLFFNYGQAIHGAGSVPPRPASKGCARLTTGDQDKLISWLGLAKRTTETWYPKDINMMVAVQGEFVGRKA